jgi:hypothetical protein
LPPFPSNTLYLNDQGPSIATGDFNGDGIPDLVALSNLTLNVYLRKGNGQFQVPKVPPEELGSPMSRSEISIATESWTWP